MWLKNCEFLKVCDHQLTLFKFEIHVFLSVPSRGGRNHIFRNRLCAPGPEIFSDFRIRLLSKLRKPWIKRKFNDVLKQWHL